jgi:hypothetical protein
MESSGHRENILKPEFDELGVGIVRAADGVAYVTEDFVRGVLVRSEAEVRTFILAALDDIRKRRGLAPLLPVDDIHETAQDFARAKSEGRPVGTVSAGYGETLVHFYAGPGLDEIVSAMARDPIAPFRLAGVGVRFARTSTYPGGAYFVCVFLLVGSPALHWSEEERIGAVLRTVNAFRSDAGRKALGLNPELSLKAEELGRRYGMGESRPSLPEAQAVAVFYETPDLDRIAADLQRHILNRACRKVGISVRPVEAGGRLNVNFIVVLLLED